MLYASLTHCLIQFQYACRHNAPNMVKLLIENNADVQARNTLNGHVPLHDAARVGNLAAIKILLEAGSPCKPRTTSGEFPADFAKMHGHTAVVQFLGESEFWAKVLC